MKQAIQIQNILDHFPHNICFIYYIIDSIFDGNGGEGCFAVENYEIDFCRDKKEKEFWKNNIKDFRYLFTAAILKYYSKKYKELQRRLDRFEEKYYGEILNESDLFFKKYRRKNLKILNITDFLYTEPDFSKTNNNITEVTDIEIDKNSEIHIEKRTLDKSTHKNMKGKTESYGVDYEYVTTLKGQTIEHFKYDRIPGLTMVSRSMRYTSDVHFSQTDCYFDLKDVVSIAATNDGFVYIIREGENYLIKGQGFFQTSRLIRQGKTPICVKASGNRVVVLMSDGTLTSNFDDEKSGIREAWFDNGKLNVIEK